MLDNEEILRLVSLAQQGDKDAKTVLLEENSPLIKSIIKRFKGKGSEGAEQAAGEGAEVVQQAAEKAAEKLAQ